MRHFDQHARSRLGERSKKKSGQTLDIVQTGGGGSDRDPQSPNPYFEKWSKQRVIKQSKFTPLILSPWGQNNESTFKVSSKVAEGGGGSENFGQSPKFDHFFFNVPLTTMWVLKKYGFVKKI